MKVKINLVVLKNHCDMKAASLKYQIKLTKFTYTKMKSKARMLKYRRMSTTLFFKIQKKRLGQQAISVGAALSQIFNNKFYGQVRTKGKEVQQERA